MLKARETFHGHRFTVAAGTVVDDDDPIVAGRETLFEPVDDEGDQLVAVAKPRTSSTTRPTRSRGGRHARRSR